MPNPDQRADARHVRNVNVDVGEQEALPDAAADRHHLQPVRRDRVRGQEEGRLRQGAGRQQGRECRSEVRRREGRSEEGRRRRTRRRTTEEGREERVPPDQLVAQQVFVTTGGDARRSGRDLKGLDEGAEVVTSGQVKLKNGTPIMIDNSVQPANSPNPTPQEQ